MERADLYDEIINDFALQVQPGASRDLPLAARRPEPELREIPDERGSAPPPSPR